MNKPVTILYTLTQGINEIFNNYFTEEKPSDEPLWLAVSELLRQLAINKIPTLVSTQNVGAITY